MDNDLESKIKEIEDKLEKMDEKLDLILNFLEKDVKVNCDKMGEHIDFVENVYDNVKNPLGYLCNKINFFSNKNKDYTLENIKKEEDGLKLTDQEIDDIIMDGVIN